VLVATCFCAIVDSQTLFILCQGVENFGKVGVGKYCRLGVRNFIYNPATMITECCRPGRWMSRVIFISTTQKYQQRVG